MAMIFVIFLIEYRVGSVTGVSGGEQSRAYEIIFATDRLNPVVAGRLNDRT
jgi:hypothetical protein